MLTGNNSSFALRLKAQKRMKELYPDGNVPEKLKSATGTGMTQGNMGGALGGGAGMAM